MKLRQVCLMLGLGTALAAHGQSVRVRGGQLAGTTTAGVVSYKGVPYAAPPVGDLRWRPPVAAAPWQGVRAATDFGPSCIQDVARSRLPWTAEFMTQNATSEDCLSLNVWTPAKPGKQLPIYVYLHGGGFDEGSSSIAIYDGANLAKRGIVVVTINYRLGYLGQMAHPLLTAESAHHASGSYSLLDVVAALQWVHANIAAFGGDPAQVTLGGQSAGSMMVYDLATSPLAKGLFVRAILESGSGSIAAIHMQTLAEQEQAGIQFSAATHADTLAAMRALPADALLTSRLTAIHAPRLQPDVDGWVLPQSPRSAYAQGRQNHVAWLVGMQADEGSSAKTYGNLSSEEFQAAIRRGYGASADEFLRLYPASAAQVAVSQIQSARDRSAVLMHLWAQAASQHSGKVYLYYFARALPWPEHPEYGAFHTSEVPYVMNTLDKVSHPVTDIDRKVSHAASTYWVNFIKTGNPNSPGLEPWAAETSISSNTLRIDEQTGMKDLVDAQKMKFWTTYLQRTFPPEF